MKVKKSQIDKPNVVGERLKKALIDKVEERFKDNKICGNCKK